jgi:hypothetical protein
MRQPSKPIEDYKIAEDLSRRLGTRVWPPFVGAGLERTKFKFYLQQPFEKEAAVDVSRQINDKLAAAGVSFETYPKFRFLDEYMIVLHFGPRQAADVVQAIGSRDINITDILERSARQQLAASLQAASRAVATHADASIARGTGWPPERQAESAPSYAPPSKPTFLEPITSRFQKFIRHLKL